MNKILYVPIKVTHDETIYKNNVIFYTRANHIESDTTKHMNTVAIF